MATSTHSSSTGPQLPLSLITDRCSALHARSSRTGRAHSRRLGLRTGIHWQVSVYPAPRTSPTSLTFKLTDRSISPATTSNSPGLATIESRRFERSKSSR